MQQTPRICDAAAVRAACPIACGLLELCLPDPAQTTTPTYSLWNKIEKVEAKVVDQGLGVLCPRQGIDPPALCRVWNSSGAVSAWPGLPWDPPGATTSQVPDMADCDVVERVTDQFCAFPGGVPSTFNVDIQTEPRGWTISLWVKSTGPNSLDSKGAFAPVIVFYTSVAPAVPLVAFFQHESGDMWAEFQTFCGSGNSITSTEEVPNNIGRQPGQSYEPSPNTWTFLAATYNPVDKTVMYTINSAHQADKVTWNGWCAPPRGGFVEAVGLSQELLISGVQITPRALSKRELTTEFYEQRDRIALRYGPTRTNEEQLMGRIPYQRQLYDAPVFITAPPLLRVSQGTAQTSCSAAFGEELHEYVWQGVNPQVGGSRCAAPYSCDAQEASIRVLSCTDPKHRPATHLGRMPTPSGQVCYSRPPITAACDGLSMMTCV
mgnify:CR=1 FL=1